MARTCSIAGASILCIGGAMVLNGYYDLDSSDALAVGIAAGWLYARACDFIYKRRGI